MLEFSYYLFFFKNPFEYSALSTEENIEEAENQKKVLRTLRDWDLW